MRKVLKWVGIFLAALIGLIVIASIAVVLISRSKANKSYDVETADYEIPSDEASIAEGERLIAIRGCADCHGEDFSGGLLLDDPAFGTFYTMNLTGGSGSSTSLYTPQDWDLAIRHGIRSDGKPLVVMPSTDYYGISDEDFGLMVAYLQNLPEVHQDEPYPDPKLGPLAYLLVASGQIEYAAAEIDHSTPPPKSVAREVSAEYGSYLATTCTGCHRTDFSGGPIPGGPPGYPPAANLTPGGELGSWTQEDFINTLRTGKTPEGHELDPEYMPWPMTLRMTEDELSAIWLYLSALEPVETES